MRPLPLIRFEITYTSHLLSLQNSHDGTQGPPLIGQRDKKLKFIVFTHGGILYVENISANQRPGRSSWFSDWHEKTQTCLSTLRSCISMPSFIEFCSSIRNIATNVASILPRTCRLFSIVVTLSKCGQIWSQKQPYMTFWASFPQIYEFQQAKLILKLTIWIGLAWACWNRKI